MITKHRKLPRVSCSTDDITSHSSMSSSARSKECRRAEKCVNELHISIPICYLYISLNNCQVLRKRFKRYLNPRKKKVETKRANTYVRPSTLYTQHTHKDFIQQPAPLPISRVGKPITKHGTHSLRGRHWKSPNGLPLNMARDYH